MRAIAKKNSIALILALLFMISLMLPVRAGEVLDRIQKNGFITIANRDASIPFSFLSIDKQPIGYAIDICIRVANAIKDQLKRPDLQVRFVEVTSSTRIPAIVDGKADLECGSTTNTTERRKYVSYSIPYFIAGARMLVKTSSGIKNWPDLRGRTVVTTKDTTNAQSIARRNDVRSLHITLIEARDHGESFKMVEQGKADAFAMDDVLLFGLRANSKIPADFAIVGDLLTVEPYAIMLSKNDPQFKKIVDSAMGRIINSGEIYTLYKKWFQRPIPPKNVNLDMPMGMLLRTSLRFPSDKVAR
jgi:glutamate/aspartate transport system substrate-binding protein